MSLCLCCGKPLRSESANNWHKACIKTFFGTSKFPHIDISEETLRQLATDSTTKGFTVPGVQKKLSLHLSPEDTPRLTLVNYPTGYILKPQTEEYAALPEMEYLVMQMAQVAGIKTVPYGLLHYSQTFAYITKRIDRENGKMLAMEDFCQLDGRLTEDKYRGSYERCAKIVAAHSVSKELDLTELFLRIVFSFAVGNSDMHLKNFSLIERADSEYILSPAYDMLSTNVVLPEDREQLALTLNGKKQNIRRKDFFVFAEAIGIGKKSAEKMIEKLIKLRERFIAMCAASYLPEDLKRRLAELVEDRLAILEGK